MPFLTSTNPIVTISGVSPIASTEGVTPIISIQSATVDQKGAVQLEDSITSTSITKAATPKSVKESYEYTTTVSGVLKTNIDGKSDIEHVHIESDITDLDKYTRNEVDSLITTISGKLDDHNELNNLDYASSGHTGFQPSGDYLTDTEFSTYSGTLQSQIDDKSAIGHDHDDLYYTESEIDTISGTLQTDLNTLSEQVSSVTKVLYVDGNRTDSYTENGSITRPFKTIQAAINQIATNGDNSTYGYLVKIAVAEYVENVVIEDASFTNIIFDTLGAYINPASGNAVQSTSNNDNLSYLEFRGIEFVKPINFEGASNGTSFGGILAFTNCLTDGFLTVKNVNSFNFIGGGILAGILYSNCGAGRIELEAGIKSGGSFTIESDNNAKKPAGWIGDSYGSYLILTNTISTRDVVFSQLNGGAGTLQLRNGVRLGASGTTIPAGATITAYQSVLRGNYVNNGTLTLYNSMVTGNITGNNPVVNFPASQLKNDSSVTGVTIKDALDYLATVSGSLQTNIDGKSDLDHIHDDRYYTESEVDTISGSLQIYIDNKATTLIDLTDTPSSYDTGKYLRSTVSGTEWATASGINGTIFIYDLTPDAGNISITFGENNQRAVSALASVDVTQITCDVFAYSGHSNIRPAAKVNNQSITWSTSITKDPVAYLGVVTVPTAGSLIAEHEDGATHTVDVTTDATPVIFSVGFVNEYPGSQTELKSGDTFDINVVTDIDFVKIQVDAQQAFSSIQTNTVTEGTDRTSTFIIGDRGVVTHTYPARVRVQKSTGTWSDWVWTNGTGNIDEGVDGSQVVALNNLYPSVESMVQGSVTYPASQEAIKNTESVTVHSTCSNFDTITYSSPAGELTIPNTGTYQEDKASVTRNSGGYNVSSTNYRIVCVRTANNASVTKNLVIYIAHDACTINMTEPYAYLRSGGNDGTSAQDYTITLTSNQRLISTPTISDPAAGAGTWVGFFAGGSIVWTRTLQIHDTDTKGVYSYGTLSATNLANTETTTYTGDSSYTLRGFVSREIELPAFDNEVNMNVEAITYANVSMTWSAKALPYKRSVGTTATPDAGAWCLHTLSTNPTIIRILDTPATDSQSQASTITIQEVI